MDNIESVDLEELISLLSSFGLAYHIRQDILTVFGELYMCTFKIKEQTTCQLIELY